MTKPTKPGFYWLKDTEWTIVEISTDVKYGFEITYLGNEQTFPLDDTVRGEWGPKIGTPDNRQEVKDAQTPIN